MRRKKQSKAPRAAVVVEASWQAGFRVFYDTLRRAGTQGQGEAGVNGAAVGSVVVIGLLVGLLAVGVASRAGHGGAVAATRGGNDAEAVFDEVGVGAQVDGGHVPEDGVAGLGVLELQDVGLGLGGGELDGNATAVVVGLPAAGVGSAARRKGLHVTDSIRNRPRVDVGSNVVDNGDTTTSGVLATGVGEGRSETSHGGNESSLEEHLVDGEERDRRADWNMMSERRRKMWVLKSLRRIREWTDVVKKDESALQI